MRRLRPFVLALILIVFAVDARSQSPAVTVIEHLHATLLEVMKNAQQLGFKGRYQKLDPVLQQTFDFPRMIAVAVGQQWTTASDEQRRKLITAFTNLSVTTYAARFNGFSGESFEVLGERPGPRDTVLVDTRINRPTEGPVAITYVMAERDGAWQIIDVLLDRSISEMAVRRSEYAQVLREGGPDKLAETLDAKAEELAKP